MDRCSEQSSPLDKFLGKWVEVKREGFEPVARVMGFSGEIRASIENSRSVVGYNRNGDTWTVQLGVAEAPQIPTYTFRFGEPYFSSSLDGTPMKGMVLPEGDRLVSRHVSTGPNPVVIDIVREVQGDTMIGRITVGGETLVTIYRKE